MMKSIAGGALALLVSGKRLLGVVVLLAGAGACGSAAAQGRPDSGGPQFVPDEVLIQFRAGVSEDEQASARGVVGASHDDLIVPQSARHDGRGDLELARLPPGLAVAAAVRELQAHPAVEFAEPNWIYHHQATTSNDLYYENGTLWGMYGDVTSPANQYGSQAGEAWARGNVGSNSVFVAVIDEGIMHTHADLTANIWRNPFEPVDGIDNDGNGYVDDVNGWDFAGNDNIVYDGGSGDKHGTHVAGTIGATGGNTIGVAGVNWNVTIISAKFLGKNGGTTANAIKAVKYVTDLKTRHGLNIVATNNSWGGGGVSQGLLDAINEGGAAGILFIAAAGNGGRDGVGDNNDQTPHYPSSYKCTETTFDDGRKEARDWDCLIAVAAIDSQGRKASFSNFGVTSVDLGAPGVNITSTLPGKAGSSTYGAYSGTSMATPHVTGAAALYAASHPGATAKEIREAIAGNGVTTVGSSLPTTALNGKTVTGGRLNVEAF